jgi:preprotein translocase subunit SecD
MEKSWYFKLSIVLAMLVVSVVVILGAIPQGQNIPLIGQYVNTEFQLGLDLSGGERLVYDVLIDDAIRQRRRQTGSSLASLVSDDLHVSKVGYREEGDANFYLLFEGPGDAGKVSHSYIREHGWAEDLSRSDASEAHFEVREGATQSVREVARRASEALKRTLGVQDLRVEVLPNRRFAIFVDDAATLRRIDDAAVSSLQDVTLVGRFTKKLELRLSDDARTSMIDTAVNQAMEVIGNRIDELGLVNTTVSQSGTSIIVEIPAGGGQRQNKVSGAGNTTATERVAQIKRIIERTARLEFRIVDDTERRLYQKLQTVARDDSRVEIVPDDNSYFLRASDTKQADGTIVPGYKILSDFISQAREKGTVDIPDSREFLFEEITPRQGRETTKRNKAPVERVWRSYYVNTEARVTGEHIADAHRAFETQGPESGQPYVALNFNDEGTRAFGQITKANVGKRMAIVLDDKVNSAPVIQEAILGGSARITLGGMTRSRDEQLEEAQELVVVLRAGGLPAPITLVNEETIGPQLGRDAIWQGEISLLVGGIAVFLFMIVYYKWSGVVADIAQVLNLGIIFAIMGILGATLTLPGLAGIVITIGMAVDGNVIINERVREELRAGKSPRSAVEAGYQRAFWTIFDSQFTTFIAGVVLLDQGTGPIKGFAVTLLIGLVTSMITSIFVTKVMFDWWTHRQRLETLSI